MSQSTSTLTTLALPNTLDPPRLGCRYDDGEMERGVAREFVQAHPRKPASTHRSLSLSRLRPMQVALFSTVLPKTSFLYEALKPLDSLESRTSKKRVADPEAAAAGGKAAK